MDGKIFAHALANTRGKELQMVYALLFRTNMLQVVTAKTKDLFNKDVDHFSATLNEEVKKLENMSDGELQMRLILELSRTFQLEGRPLHNAEDIEWQCDCILHAVHQMMREQDAQYVEFIKNTDELIYESIVHFEMQKLFTTFDEKYRQLEETEARTFAKHIFNTLHELPLAKLKPIQDRLNLFEVSEQTIHEKLQAEGTILICTVLIEYIGYSAYADVTKSMANTLKTMGSVLPFGMYTFATALLSVIVNPLFLLPLAIGGGSILIQRQTKGVQKKLIPIGIVQILLPVLSDAQKSIGAPCFEEIINSWQLAEIRYDEYQVKRGELLQQRAQTEQNIVGLQATIRDYDVQQDILVKQKNILYAEIQLQMFNIPNNMQSAIYRQTIHELDMCTAKLQRLHEQQQQNKLKTGLWQTITSTVDNTKIANAIKLQQKEIERLRDVLCNEVINIQPEPLDFIVQKFNGLDFELKNIQAAIANEQQHLTNEKAQLQNILHSLKLLEKQTKKMEKDIYGLGVLHKIE